MILDIFITRTMHLQELEVFALTQPGSERYSCHLGDKVNPIDLESYPTRNKIQVNFLNEVRGSELY